MVAWTIIGASALLALGALAAPAFAHIERPSYWPDPGPDTSVSPPAGGKVPKARSLESAVTGKGPGEVRVVCKGTDGKASLQCRYHEIQPAIEDSGNNDRVVITPGRYTEPTSRKQPTNDPRCNPSLLQEDQTGALTPSYEYQAACPNDQNLIYDFTVPTGVPPTTTSLPVTSWLAFSNSA